MPARLALLLLVALLVAAPSATAAPLSLALHEPPAERAFALDVSGSYGASPVAIIFRDAMFGGLLGLAAGAVVGFAADSDHTGRDAAIGAGAGLLLGAVVGAFDAESVPRISVHADRAGGAAVGLRAPF